MSRAGRAQMRLKCRRKPAKCPPNDRKLAPRTKLGRWMKIASSCLDLASGLGLKYGTVKAGHASASNAQDARLSSSRAHGVQTRFGTHHKFPHLPSSRRPELDALQKPRV